jgi:hypothetical protein
MIVQYDVFGFAGIDHFEGLLMILFQFLDAKGLASDALIESQPMDRLTTPPRRSEMMLEMR